MTEISTPEEGFQSSTDKLEDTSRAPSAIESIESEDVDEEDDDDLYDVVGFLFEGSQATTPQRFTWELPESSSSASAFSVNNSGQKRQIQVSLESIDDIPGAVISGHYLWPAAELMVDYIISQSSPSADSNIVSILELGAGCALASLSALQVWQTSLQCLVVTDHDPGTLQRARNNYETTLEEIMNASQTEDELNNAINTIASIPVCFQELHWGKKSDEEAVCELLEEHTNDASCRFDLILGTDLIYCPQVVEPLLQTAARFIKASPRSRRQDDNHNEDKDDEGNECIVRAGGRFWLSQSFAYDDETEALIDSTCNSLGLVRTILLENGPERRVQEFRMR